MNMLSSPVCLYALAMAQFILVARTAHSLMGDVGFAEWQYTVAVYRPNVGRCCCYMVSFL